VTRISAAAAEALSAHKGRLYLGLTCLGFGAAAALANHQGSRLYFYRLTRLNKAAAAALESYGGALSFGAFPLSPDHPSKKTKALPEMMERRRAALATHLDWPILMLTESERP